MGDPFSVLGVPASMELSDEQIESAALMLSAQLHPDTSGPDSESERRLAEINEARGILSNPETRAIALLELLGGPSASADRTLPAGFLAEMMQVREQIEEASEAGDAAAMGEWKRWASRRRGEHAERVRGLFAAGRDPGTLRAIRHELNAWRYIERLIEQVN